MCGYFLSVFGTWMESRTAQQRKTRHAHVIVTKPAPLGLTSVAAYYVNYYINISVWNVALITLVHIQFCLCICFFSPVFPALHFLSFVSLFSLFCGFYKGTAEWSLKSLRCYNVQQQIVVALIRFTSIINGPLGSRSEGRWLLRMFQYSD